MGAVTVAIKRRDFTEGGRITIADVTFSSSYAAGGDTFTKAQFEVFGNIDAIIDAGTTGSATTGYALAPDLANSKIRLLQQSAATGAFTETATAGQTGTVARVVVYHSNPYI